MLIKSHTCRRASAGRLRREDADADPFLRPRRWSIATKREPGAPMREGRRTGQGRRHVRRGREANEGGRSTKSQLARLCAAVRACTAVARSTRSSNAPASWRGCAGPHAEVETARCDCCCRETRYCGCPLALGGRTQLRDSSCRLLIPVTQIDELISDLRDGAHGTPEHILEDLIEAGNAENWLWKHMVLRRHRRPH